MNSNRLKYYVGTGNEGCYWRLHPYENVVMNPTIGLQSRESLRRPPVMVNVIKGNTYAMIRNWGNQILNQNGK